MKIHVIQREGRRHFSRFTDIAERDRLQVELQIEDKNGQTILIDLTEALIGEYSKHPELGRISTPSAVAEITSLQPIKPLAMKRSKTVAPAYLADSSTTGILAKVREAQMQAAEEKRQKQAEFAAARAERLAVAREAKAEKQRAESRGQKAKGAATPKAKKAAAPKAAKAAPAKTKPAGITKTQAQAIEKIGKALAKEDKVKRPSRNAGKPGTLF